MAEGQDWCLSCGAGAPGSLGSPPWRSAATVLAAVLVLGLGAAAAAVAALDDHRPHQPALTTTVARAPVTPPTGATVPKAPGATASTPKASTGPLGLGGAKPPKIPPTAASPKASEVAKTKAGAPATLPKTTSTPTNKTSSSTAAEEAREASEESQQPSIVLDTDAASTYNPYGYPTTWFGDPARAIDGDPSTAWTAQVDPSTAPNMAVGLLVDLKSKQRVSSLTLITSTIGLTVQVYGAKTATVPTSITDPTWTPLTPPKVAKKKHLRMKLRHGKEAFTFIALWISKAPPSSTPTTAASEHVSVNEVELFPTS